MHELDLQLRDLRLSALQFANPGKPKLLALHGWLDNAASFLPMAPYLEQFDWVALDLVGHGRSDHRAPGAWYHYVDYLGEIVQVLDALGWQQCHLLGHSLGGALASVLAAAIPERIERLYLIEALGPISTPEERALGLLREAIKAREAINGKQLRLFRDLDQAIAARRSNPDMPLSESAARLLCERGTRAQDGGLMWSSDPRLTLTSAIRLTEGQIRNYLSGIQAPTRIVFANPSPGFINPDAMLARVGLLPQVEVVRLSGTHHLHMEQPEAVAQGLGLLS